MARVCEIYDIILGDMRWPVLEFLTADMSVIREGGLLECGLLPFPERKQIQINHLRRDARALLFTCSVFHKHMSAFLAAVPLPVKHMYGMIERRPLDAVVIKLNMHPDFLISFGLPADDVESGCIIFQNWHWSTFVGVTLHAAFTSDIVTNMLAIEVAPYDVLGSLEESCDECTERAVAYAGLDWNERELTNIRCLEVFLKPGHVVTFMFTGEDPLAFLHARYKMILISQKPGFYMMSSNNWIVRIPFDKLDEFRNEFVLKECESFGGSYTCDLYVPPVA